MPDRWNRVSASPTNPGSGHGVRELTAEDLFRPAERTAVPLDERLRQVYYWIVNRAVISPYYDMEFSHGEPLAIELGDAGATVTLPTQASFSSNVLVPLLTFAVGGKCLLIGGPGRGKTTVAVLMGVLAGTASDDVRRAVQQGQPQSALLTMVVEGYVESHDQMRRTAPDGGVESWFFTANDDAGGGTFPVIQALRDRMDVTVQAAGFNSRFFDELITRVEAGEKPEEHLPAELAFDEEQRSEMRAAVRAVPIPDAVRDRLRFFLSHFEFVQHGGRRFEYRTKDVVTTSGGRVGEVIEANSGADLDVDLGAQTRNGLSVRALQTLILYSKAMAWFRGVEAVELDDVAAVLPFVLRGKLLPNTTHPRFDVGAERELSTDTVSWLADLFAQSCRQYDSLGRDSDDQVARLLDEFDGGLDGVSALEASRRITAVEAQLRRIATVGKLYGRDFDDVIALKYLHQRYTAYVRWQELRG